jgi:hypothetical protein
MKVLNLGISLKGMTLERGEFKDLTPEAVCVNVIKEVIMAWIKQVGGMRGDDRKKYHSLCESLESAISKNKKTVQLSDEQVGFIRRAFREAALAPVELLKRVEDKVGDIANR